MLTLAGGFELCDLYERDGLVRVDAAFVTDLQAQDASLAQQLLAARADPSALSRKQEAELLLCIAPHLQGFLARLFRIESELGALVARHEELAPLYRVKRQFVQRKAMARVKADEAAAIDGAALEEELVRLFDAPFSEFTFARYVEAWHRDEVVNAPALSTALRYAAWAIHSATGRARHRDGVLFKVPRKLDPMRLVPIEESSDGPVRYASLGHLRHRDGFALTDAGKDLTGALDEANYCIWCHEQGKDSCSRGLTEKAPADGSRAAFRKSPFGVTLAGCPLEERISEFQKLKAQGCVIGALAVITVDNPMVAATGHRICNDCMKSCIYQKQDPVDIPQAETRTLKDVLELPWGFEIYGLLTRWNPLSLRSPLPCQPSGRRVLVVGMGPAGFTLAHYLLNEGHVVVAIDGLKIEPLPSHLCGVDAAGKRVPFEPIHDVRSLYERLDERVMAGFGGVRFGGTLTASSAFELGFDHVALCVGAGKPTVLELPNGLARGVRTASDFLMALQLTGAARRDSVANLQLRMPVVVIGGGLTAIDTATEALAYYPVQVEKFLLRFEALASEQGEAGVRAAWTDEERAIAGEFLEHARALRAERALAASQGRRPRILELLRSWGGVTIAYRRRLIDSPSYTLNHEEVEKALEEGIRIAECLTPVEIQVDEHGHARSVLMSVQTRDPEGRWASVAQASLPARSVLVAAGTQPNTVLAREDESHFKLDGRYFEACDDQGRTVKPERGAAKPGAVHVLMSPRPDGRFMSYFGDVHPSFFGNVVKAMGSARLGYRAVSAVVRRMPPACSSPDQVFLDRLNQTLRATVSSVVRLTPNIVEVVVHAPAAAKAFRPGQFYRLQNFESHAHRIDGTLLAMEGLALTGAWVNRERGLVSTIVLEMGGSSDLCRLLVPGEPVVLMGPTGSPTEIPSRETVLLAGGGLGNAVLFSIGQAMRANANRVLYFAAYRKGVDRYKIEEIEAAADLVVWCCDEAPGFEPRRAQDRAFVGNVVAAMVAYANGSLGSTSIGLAEVDRVIAIGSDRMMAAVARARHDVLAAWLKPGHIAIGSINSPMQCMMKEICAQCLQPQRDPITGRIEAVFSCFNQDQPLDRVDFSGLSARLAQNSVQEKLAARWIGRCLARLRDGRSVPTPTL